MQLHHSADEPGSLQKHDPSDHPMWCWLPEFSWLVFSNSSYIEHSWGFHTTQILRKWINHVLLCTSLSPFIRHLFLPTAMVVLRVKRSNCILDLNLLYWGIRERGDTSGFKFNLNISFSLSLSLSLSLSIYIYIYMYIYVCVCIYIHIYTYMICPECIQPYTMKNRDIYRRRYKIQETLYIGQWCLVPFKMGTLGPHPVLPIAISCPIICSWGSSMVWNFFSFKGDLSFGKSQKPQGTKPGL